MVELSQDQITEVLAWLLAIPSDDPTLKVRVTTDNEGVLSLHQIRQRPGQLTIEKTCEIRP